MAKKTKVIISCAITGAIHTPTMSPHIPITPDEIAQASIEAAEAGVFPGGNKMTLKNRLEKEFINQTKGRRFAAGPQKPIIDPKDPKFEELKKLMSEGF